MKYSCSYGKTKFNTVGKNGNMDRFIYGRQVGRKVGSNKVRRVVGKKK